MAPQFILPLAHELVVALFNSVSLPPMAALVQANFSDVASRAAA